ncbi:hypothetical protein C2845_PM13G21630 [Panicum miliaceum]|uniref:KIB1-4 beta-propeller domain-containing protein n=1 Tax=Panicum miliaceum TaxID=4540 RepID=A0A3L6RLZ4_PANMI|nr:hypothetical protein C2845_PM13G21630 [Panicum miliaceum]
MTPRSKLRRLTRSAGAGEVSPDWASLDRDLVELIGWRVLAGDLQDYVRLRAVCAHWSASTAAPRGRGVLDPRFHPRRWMMLPEGHGLYPGHPDLGGFVRFFNLSTGAFVRAHLPLLDDHVVLDSADGLLLLHRDHDTAIRVLHPFTGDVAELPPLASLLPQMEPNRYGELNKRSKLMKFCTSITVSSTGAITVMLVLHFLHRVAHATTGDQRWTLSAWNLKPLIKPVSFQGKLYALQVQPILRMCKVYIYKINPPCPNANEGPSHLPLPEKIAECPLEKFIYMLNFVECGAELLLVAYSDASHSRLVVSRFADLVRGKNEPVTSIGDNAFFIYERCLCVSVSPNKGSKSLASIPPNSIICWHSVPVSSGFAGPTRFEQYDLGTGIWTPASDGDIRQRPPPSPHTLIHHIFTCCSRRYWNKGLMVCRETEPIWMVKQDLRHAA